MDGHPTPSSDTVEQAADRTARHLAAAVAAIDARLGEGYAKDNPELVAAFLQSASIQSAVLSGEATVQIVDATVRESIETVDRSVQRAVDRMAASVEYLKPRLF